MGQHLVDARRLNATVLAVAVVGYAVAQVDSESWVWAPLLIPMAVFVARAVDPRIPAWVLLLVADLNVVSINMDLNAEGAYFLVCLSAFAVGSESQRWFPERALLALAIVSPIVNVIWGDSSTDGWNWPFWSMGILISGFFGGNLYQQRRLTEALADAQRQLADQAAGEERRRIAREVHDLVGHSLTVVLLHLTGARRLVRRDPDEAEAALHEAERAGRQSLADIRATVALLRDAGDGRRPTPGGRDIDDLIRESCAAGMDIRSTIVGALHDIDETTGLAAYRIVQEALANAARHSAGGPTTVHVEVADDDVRIDVTNHASISAPSSDGSGLVGMSERAEAIGGQVTAGRVSGEWVVRAVLPRSRRVAGA